MISLVVSFVKLVQEHIKDLFVYLVLLFQDHPHLGHGETRLQSAPDILGLGLAILEGAGCEKLLDEVASDDLGDCRSELRLGGRN